MLRRLGRRQTPSSNGASASSPDWSEHLNLKIPVPDVHNLGTLPGRGPNILLGSQEPTCLAHRKASQEAWWEVDLKLRGRHDLIPTWSR